MQTAASEFVVALDIGSARTRCLIAEADNGSLRLVGRGEEPSRGVRRGEVIDLAAARYGVNHAIAAAEQTAGLDVQTLFLGVGSRHVTFLNNRACVGITREEQIINARDVRKALGSASRIPLRDDALTIGTLTCGFSVDDIRQVRQPEGMHGTRLEAEVHVITDARGTVENMAACLAPGKRQIEGHVFNAHAAGHAVLDPDEKRLGCAVIDIGAGTTRLMVYRDDAPVFSSTVPVGGDHITNDIAIGTGLCTPDAEQLKEDHASVGPARLDRPITFRALGKGSVYSVDPRRLNAIVDARVTEMLDIIRRELMRTGTRPSSIRAVLTGGTSRLAGLDALASTVIGCPVRVGRPRLQGDTFGPVGPELATAVGILLAGLTARRRQSQPLPAASRALQLVNWMRQFF